MKCKNPNCYAGHIRRFRGAKAKRKALFYDAPCPDCKGNWRGNQTSTAQLLVDYVKSTVVKSGGYELPF